MFGENVTEGLKNCLAYDTTIEACYLQGDFGVYSKGEFVSGKTRDIAGNITLEKTFEYNGGATVLKLCGRHALSEIKVNGVAVEKSYFSDTVNLKEYIKYGKNNIEITLWTDNRNLLGPFHYAECEKPDFVGPDNFELFGSWKDGESALQRKDYTFVRFGVFED